MARWFPTFNRKQEGMIASTTVPLVNDLSSVVYPEDNYKNYAKEGYSRNTIVNACIRELATGVATAKFYVEQETEDGFIEATNTPLSQLIMYPNADQDFYHWVERMITYLYVSGNVYVLKERNRGNQITGMYLLRPDRVSIMPSGEGVKGYSYEIDGKEYYLDKKDVGHLSLPNPNGDLYGLSPLHVLSRTINLDLSMTDFAKQYFQNAGVPSGLLKVKRQLRNQEEADRIRSRWRTSFGGTRNMHKIAVLDDDAEYQQMASDPSNMAMTEMHNHTESRICSVLGVPPILISANVGLQRSTFANYKEARLSFHSETLEPLINKVVRFLNYCVGYELGETVAVDFSQMRAFMDDKETDNKRATDLFTAGIITLNEARELVGQESLPEGEVRRMPVNIIESMSPTANAFPVGTSGFLSTEAEESKEVEFPDGNAPIMDLGRVVEDGMKLGNDLNQEKVRIAQKYTPRLEKYLNRIRSRVSGILGRHMERQSEITKDGFPFTTADLVPDGDVDDLAKILYAMYKEISQSTIGLINESGVAGTTEWEEDSPVVTSLLTQAPARAKLIHSTTQKRVQEGIKVAFERGYSIQQLARGVPDEGFKGLQATLGETEVRGKLIARTEIMRSQNLTSCNLYKRQGFEWLRAYDTDGDPNDTYVSPTDPYGRTCAERNGKIYNVNDAYDIEDHPNGTLSWIPMPRNYVHTEQLGELIIHEKANSRDYNSKTEEYEEFEFPQGIGTDITKIDIPDYIQANARKGLIYYEEGKAGSGLTSKTVREARQLASGSVSEDKVIRMDAWFARHLTDLDAPQNSDRSNEDFPSAGAVAWYLWGGNPTNPKQVMNWASRQAERIKEKEGVAV